MKKVGFVVMGMASALVLLFGAGGQVRAAENAVYIGFVGPLTGGAAFRV